MEFTKEELNRIFFALETVRWIEQAIEESETGKIEHETDPLLKKIAGQIDYSVEYSNAVFKAIGRMLDRYESLNFDKI